MRIIFFGSGAFAVPALEALVSAGYGIICVVTQPDRKKGRGLPVSVTPLKGVAQKQGLRLYQPENINAKEAVEFLKSLAPDLFIVIAYGQILSKILLDVPKIFAVNLHASLLPKYRGAAPVNWAIIKGDTCTGVTVIKMNEKMDTGHIIAQERVRIEADDNAFTLGEKLADCGSRLLTKTIRVIAANRYALAEQDESLATMAPKLQKHDGLIDWTKSAVDIYNLIRGCYGWPSAFTRYNKKILKIFAASVVPLQAEYPPGSVIKLSGEGILIAAGKDGLLIKELQVEGKRIMCAHEFLAGHKIYPGDLITG